MKLALALLLFLRPLTVKQSLWPFQGERRVRGYVALVGEDRVVELCDRGGRPCLLVYVPLGERLPERGERVEVVERL